MESICAQCMDPCLRPIADFLNRERKLYNLCAILWIFSCSIGFALFFWADLTIKNIDKNQDAALYAICYVLYLAALLLLSWTFRRTVYEHVVMGGMEENNM